MMKVIAVSCHTRGVVTNDAEGETILIGARKLAFFAGLKLENWGWFYLRGRRQCPFVSHPDGRLCGRTCAIPLDRFQSKSRWGIGPVYLWPRCDLLSKDGRSSLGRGLGNWLRILPCLSVGSQRRNRSDIHPQPTVDHGAVQSDNSLPDGTLARPEIRRGRSLYKRAVLRSSWCRLQIQMIYELG